MTTVAERNVASAEDYYKAMSDKNVSGMAQYLHPDVQLVGPLDALTGKEAVLEAAKRFFNFIKSINVRAKLGSGDQVMLAYDMDFGEPVGNCRSAVWMTFKDGLIARSELFFDARPFGSQPSKSTVVTKR